MPLECRWVESGRELSTVAAALYAGRSLVLSSWYRYCGTYNSPTDNTRLKVTGYSRELASTRSSHRMLCVKRK